MGRNSSYKIENTILYQEIKKVLQKEDVNYICNALSAVYAVLFLMKHLEENDKLKGLYKELKMLLDN